MLTPSLFETISAQLRRPAEGCQQVIAWMSWGEPAIVRVASIVNGVPFPTLFWVTHRSLVHEIHRCESAGLTGEIQARIDNDPELQRALVLDNQQHVRLREQWMTDTDRRELERLGALETLSQRGIGGNGNWQQVRCLHAYLAADQAVSNTIGRLVREICGPGRSLVRMLNRLTPDPEWQKARVRS